MMVIQMLERFSSKVGTLFLLAVSSACTSTVDGTGAAPVVEQADTPPPPRASQGIQTVEQLFDPPSFGKATAGDVIGLWSSGSSTDEQRMLIRADSIMLARRCTTDAQSRSDVTASATVAARVDQSSVAVLEPEEDVKSTPDGTCKVTLVVGEVEHCGYRTTDCFHMPGTGTQLTFYGTSSAAFGSLYGNWTKVMD